MIWAFVTPPATNRPGRFQFRSSGPVAADAAAILASSMDTLEAGSCRPSKTASANGLLRPGRHRAVSFGELLRQAGETLGQTRPAAGHPHAGLASPATWRPGGRRQSVRPGRGQLRTRPRNAAWPSWRPCSFTAKPGSPRKPTRCCTLALAEDRSRTARALAAGERNWPNQANRRQVLACAGHRSQPEFRNCPHRQHPANPQRIRQPAQAISTGRQRPRAAGKGSPQGFRAPRWSRRRPLAFASIPTRPKSASWPARSCKPSASTIWPGIT